MMTEEQHNKPNKGMLDQLPIEGPTFDWPPDERPIFSPPWPPIPPPQNPPILPPQPELPKDEGSPIREKTNSIRQRQKEDHHIHSGMLHVPIDQQKDLHYEQRQSHICPVIHDGERSFEMETDVHLQYHQQWRGNHIPYIQRVHINPQPLFQTSKPCQTCCLGPISLLPPSIFLLSHVLSCDVIKTSPPVNSTQLTFNNIQLSPFLSRPANKHSWYSPSTLLFLKTHQSLSQIIKMF